MAAGLMLAVTLIAAGPELIAHRGESADAPENTLAPFRLAWERKVPAVELDVHLTKDGRLAVCHDFDTKRCAGVACKIRESLWDDLKDLDVGRKFDLKYTGEKLPLLDDALATIPSGARCFIEIKCGPEAIPALVKVVEACGKQPQQLAIISFNADAIEAAKKKLPQLKTYYLSSFKNTGTRWSPNVDELIKQAKAINADGLDVAYRGPLDGAFVREVREAGLELYAWTVNDPDVARDLVKLGVDGITTDKAAWLREELRKPAEE